MFWDDVTVSLPIVHGNAGCLIKKNGLILAVKHAGSGKWDIPSGRPESESELAHETARRETLEETGLDVEIIRLINIFREEHNPSQAFYVYLCKIIPPMTDADLTLLPITQEEIVEAKFIDIELLNHDNVRFPEALPLIKGLFKDLPES
ncbi:MAG: superfamily protein [Rickettsiaceae bacterium]|jgi:phosphatase NudJ|nr:superfamily protein [Rickettsiaceae bacterium]